MKTADIDRQPLTAHPGLRVRRALDDEKDALRDAEAAAERVAKKHAVPLRAPPVVGWSDVSRFDGLPVCVQRNWPKVQRGKRAVRVPAHPLILWLARKLGSPQPWFARGAWSWTYQEIRVPNMIDVDPLTIDGALHCSPTQWEVLRQVVTPNDPRRIY